MTEEDALFISPTLWSALGTHHFVAVPLTTRDKTIGVILADNLYSGAPITDDSVDLLSTFASHAAMALELPFIIAPQRPIPLTAERQSEPVAP